MSSLNVNIRRVLEFIYVVNNFEFQIYLKLIYLAKQIP